MHKWFCVLQRTHIVYTIRITEITQLVSVIDKQCNFHQEETHFSKFCLDLTVRFKTVSGTDPKFNLTSLTATCHTLRRYLCVNFLKKKKHKGINHSCIQICKISRVYYAIKTIIMAVKFHKYQNMHWPPHKAL